MKKLISFGAGNMAQALIPPLASSYEIHAYSPSGKSAKILAEKSSGQVQENLKSIDADLYFICCKPQQFSDLALKLKGKLSKDALVVSILAGTTVDTLADSLGHSNILRLMPNTPSQFGHGVTLFYGEKNVDDFIGEMKKSNLMIMMKSEDQLDKVTAVTGSGPAYLFEFGRIMMEELKAMGLDECSSREMIAELFLGSSTMMKNREESFETLRNQVTSKGGVTFEALKVFTEAGLEKMTHEALVANYNRSKELAKS
jgi:pyrroline-5-carboxylate reductase